MNYTALTLKVKDEGQRQVLIALLSDAGFDGFEETEEALIAFIPYELYDEVKVLPLLNNVAGDIPFSFEIIKPKNWNEEWEKNFQPVVINNEVIIRASFHHPTKFPYEIIIDPKMSFGTGHHETTAMMIQLMLENRNCFRGKATLDFGSGTGILSILASKLGAINILAIDNEEWAYHNALENFFTNKSIHAKAIHGSGKDFSGKFFDIILANINYNIIVEHFVEISAALNPNGKLYCSGFLLSDEQGLIQAAEKTHLTPSEKKVSGNWLALTFLKHTNE